MDNEGFDIDAARVFQQKKREHKKHLLEKKYVAACVDFQDIIGMIIEKYNPQRIYQWGSLMRQEHFSEISDIDIAIEGLNSAENFFQLMSDARDMTSFPLDIVELEHIHVLQREMIKKTGRLVYERD